ncbi:hypothetical protein ABAC460_11095 [Asticcacaulis sp. AC460]|nr:hypothetical protein ABAC460_11095 [Asticcacaulis sp. AC460]
MMTAAWLVAGAPAWAETAVKPPAPALQLVAHNIRNDRGEDVDAALKISTLDIKIDIAGRMAQTTLLVTFANPTEDALEGDFSLALPIGASVTAYALDIDGVMVDGVLQPREQAREAYEEQLRQGVDPGLGEVTGNAFRTRIFPILPGAGRTVRITYIAPLGPDGRFVLPVTTGGEVEKLKLTVTALGMKAAPLVTLAGQAFTRSGEAFVLEREKVSLAGEVAVTGLEPDQPLTLTRHSNGDKFFELIVAAEPAGNYRTRTVRLYWDASRSRATQNVAAEARLVADYVARTAPKSLDLVLFSDGKPTVRHFDSPTPEVILEALSQVQYTGATRFTDLQKAVPGRADICLVVSDGRMTIDSFKPGRWPCRVLTLSSDPEARRDVLRQVSVRNGGAYVDLAELGPEAAMKLLVARGPRAADVFAGDGSLADYTVTPMGDDYYRIVGPLPRGDMLALDDGERVHTFPLHPKQIIEHDGAGVAWGAALIDALGATDTPDADKILATARRYRVATPDVSFIVLETGADYARAGIAPPATAPKALLDDYTLIRDEVATEAARRKAERLEDITDAWESQVLWWESKPLSLGEARREIQKRNRRSDDRNSAMAEMAALPAPAATPPAMEAQSDSDGMVVVTGARRSLHSSVMAKRDASGVREAGEGQIEIETAEWNPDRPYLGALKGVKPGDVAAFRAVFAEQEKANGATPAFYFDMAEWMFRNGFATAAPAVARTALELSDSDITTRIILAGRLLRYGAFDDAIWLDEQVARMTPDKPQAKRNLALAIIAATDARLEAGGLDEDAAADAYLRALVLLCEVVLTPWDDDYDGIELIALMEANHLAAKLKALDVPAGDIAAVLPKQLTALLDVDIRILLEWNTDKTDMDLWVDEPSGERSIYSNPRTLLGGRLSNDMTRGYGPEEYLLRTAPKGVYEVMANVYAADRLDPNGATNIIVHLYRDWGRPTEKEESFVIELKRDQKHEAVTVGKFKRE